MTGFILCIITNNFIIKVYNNKSMKINRLSKETSPYLLQHANNPVDWYPWGKEALNKAKIEKKPILLSIGYSACHWCHVMAHESFEDDKTAEIMNKYFINIKVDREERPDLDKIYQTSQILLNQRSGGWPLTMFLSHDNQAPFFGGTYFPNTNKYNLPSFKELLTKIHGYYNNNYDEILNHNKSIIRALDQIDKNNTSEENIDKKIQEKYMKNARSMFDKTMGGFGSAPKFPQPSVIMHILNSYQYKNIKDDLSDLNMAIYSLISMQEGGINDQLGGGFFRYSVDEVWMIPHFEKMLYDNACLLECYSKAYFITKDQSFFKTAEKIADWIINEMQSDEGGFFSSIDADSDGGEGQYYIWDKSEVEEILNKSQFKTFSNYFGLNKKSNFENKYHLYVSYNTKEEFNSRIKNVDNKLLNESIYILLNIRNKRKKPFTDEKILTSWNSLTINSLIEYYKISRNSHYLDSAEKSILFLIDNMLDRTKLNATYKNGKSHIDAYLDDYVFLINAILNFLSLKWNDKLFKKIIVLADVLIDKFLDFSDGGFYFTSKEHEALIQKPKPTADEAFPSGNSLASKIFIKLGFLMNNTKYIDAADSVFSYASKQVNDSPNAHSSLLDNYLLMNKPIITIILKTGENTDEIDLWLDLLIDLNKPYISYFYISNNNTGLKNIDDKIALGNVTAYICEGFTCEKPINDINEFSSRISLL